MFTTFHNPTLEIKFDTYAEWEAMRIICSHPKWITEKAVATLFGEIDTEQIRQVLENINKQLKGKTWSNENDF